MRYRTRGRRLVPNVHGVVNTADIKCIIGVGVSFGKKEIAYIHLRRMSGVHGLIELEHRLWLPFSHKRPILYVWYQLSRAVDNHRDGILPQGLHR